MRDELRGLPEVYQECEGILVRTPQGAAVERVNRTKRAGTTLNERAVQVRTDILAVLASWCGLVADERAVPRPERREVAHLVDYLDRHLDWLATHPAAADFAGELSTVTRAAQAVLDPDPTVRTELGTCGEVGCEQPVYATFRGESPVPQVGCTAGHVWQPHQWLLLGQRMARGTGSAWTEHAA